MPQISNNIPFSKALEKKERIFSKLNNYLRDLEKYKENLINVVHTSLQITKIHETNSDNNSNIIAVDSARGIQRYIIGNFYAFVSVAYRDNYYSDNISDFDLVSYVEEEVEFADRILEGLSMGSEIIIATSKLKQEQCDYVFMDGSVSTFILKINSAITATKNANGPLAQKMKKNYKRLIEDFIYLLESKKVFFIPKASQKDDLKQNLITNINDEEIKETIKKISDIKLAQLILSPLEYIVIEQPQSHPYNLYNPYNKDIDEIKFQNFENLKNKLFKLANDFKAFYFKGVGGYTYRIESFAKTIPETVIAQNTFTKNFYITQQADRKAKDYVSVLLQESFPLEEQIR